MEPLHYNFLFLVGVRNISLKISLVPNSEDISSSVMFLGGGFCFWATFSINIMVLADTGAGLLDTDFVGKAGLTGLIGLGRAGLDVDG